MTDLISRADAIEAIQNAYCKPCKERGDDYNEVRCRACEYDNAIIQIDALPSAEAVHKPDYSYEADMVKRLRQAVAVQGWRTGKPTENGEYMVTIDAWGHRYIDIMHYAEPQMPNREVDGACWYRAEDEWGDVVYDDADILAWMPVKPYREDDEAE